MSNILGHLLKQTCVYWPPGDSDKYGTTGYGEPEEIVCQWNKTRRTIEAPDGSKKQISATIHFAVEVEEDGFLWFGLLDDAPEVPPSDGKIVSVSETQDVDNNEKLWTAMI